jgi:hypothetical protein
VSETTVRVGGVASGSRTRRPTTFPPQSSFSTKCGYKAIALSRSL